MRERWARIVQPWWVAPLHCVVAALVCALVLFFEDRRFEGSAGLSATQLLALGAVFMAAWLIETSALGWPRLLFLAATLLPAALILYDGRDTIAPFLPMTVASWGAYAGSRRTRYVTLALALASLVPTFIPGRGELDNLVSWSLGILLTWSMGATLARQQRLLEQLQLARERLAQQAAAEERRRIAREIHDVVAHTLAVTMLHITGARHVLGREPARAAEALEQAEALGRQSLADIRRVVGLLGDDRAAVVPAAPDLDQLPALVGLYKSAGMDAHLCVDGDTTTIGPALGLDLYRIVQEALTNAARYAPGARVEVRVIMDATIVRLTVWNSAARQGSRPALGLGGGRGLLGIRERVALHGGLTDAGADRDGWLVACQIPRESRHVRQTPAAEVA
jgi:signal transduction histidine kinase